MIIVTTQQMQQMDKNTIETFGIPGRVLMENAGRGALEMLADHFDLEGTRVAVVAGRGNNGGDGFVIGRYLMEMGVSVSFFLLSTRDRVQGDALSNMDLVLDLLAEHALSQFIEIPDKESLEAVADILQDHDLFVDAIFGTGLNSDVRGIYRDVIELINDSGQIGLQRRHPFGNQCRYRSRLRCSHPGTRHGHLCLCQNRAHSLSGQLSHRFPGGD